jgi:SAM-dependent methyltransferase
MIKQIGQFLLPKRLHSIGGAIYWFGFKYQCSVCGWRLREFRPCGNPDFKEMCIRCGALARHRFIWLYLKNRTNLFTAKLSVLHFAPEACFSERLGRLRGLDYVTADVAGGYTPGNEVLDLMAIDKPNGIYDAVLCIHVLEHVADDAKAMRELFRIIKPGGWAIVNPHMDLSMEKTFEDATVTSPEERRRLFNQEDHYRVYGRDVKNRLEKAGFEVEMVPYMDAIPNERAKRYKLVTPGVIVLCRRPEYA